MRMIASKLFALLFLLVMWPHLVFVAIAIRVSDGPPVFQRMFDPALGYKMLQFRCEQGSWIGLFLKKWSIHKWPAMWDAVRGEVDTFELMRAVRESNR